MWLYGGNPLAYDEIAESWQKWQFICLMFDALNDGRLGILHNFPCAGGYLNQPYKTMCALNVLLEIHRKKTNDELNKLSRNYPRLRR